MMESFISPTLRRQLTADNCTDMMHHAHRWHPHRHHYSKSIQNLATNLNKKTGTKKYIVEAEVK